MKAVFVFVCVISASVACAQNDLTSVEWIAGNWKRVNAKPGRSGVEIWTKRTAREMVGRGISMKEKDTVFVEKLRIVSKDNKLFYVSDVPENNGEVWFEFTSVSDKGFVCENPRHDFPKKIVYQVDGNKLKAVISGDGKEMVYLFER